MNYLDIVCLTLPALLAVLLLAVDLIAPLETACIFVDTVSNPQQKGHPFVVDHLRRRFQIAPRAVSVVASGHVLILVQRLTRSRIQIGPVRAVVNHSTGDRSIDSAWGAASSFLAFAALLLLLSTVATISFPLSGLHVVSLWLPTISIAVVSLLFFKRQLDLHSLLVAIHENPIPFLVIDAEFSDAA